MLRKAGMSVKSIEASYRAEEKKRAELGGKVSIIETQLRNIWPVLLAYDSTDTTTG